MNKNSIEHYLKEFEEYPGFLSIEKYSENHQDIHRFNVNFKDSKKQILVWVKEGFDLEILPKMVKIFREECNVHDVIKKMKFKFKFNKGFAPSSEFENGGPTTWIRSFERLVRYSEEDTLVVDISYDRESVICCNLDRKTYILKNRSNYYFPSLEDIGKVNLIKIKRL